MNMSTSADLGRLAIKACWVPCALLVLLLAVPRAFGQLPGQQAYALLQQQGNKLVGTGASGSSQQGNSVAISADGNTAIVGGPDDNSNIGGAWVFTRANGVWSQQGGELIGSDAVGAAQQGWSVAISGDGNTALVGGPGDNSGVGAFWVFTRSGGVWSQQGTKVAAFAFSTSQQGWSVAISADGNTAASGADNLTNGLGGVYVFTRTAGVWSQQTGLLGFGNNETGNGQFGYSVALSADGNKLVAGGNLDNGGVGAAWLFKRSAAGAWSFNGFFVGPAATGNANQGSAVAISGDGNVFAVGGPLDSAGAGAIWIYTFQVDHYGPAGGKITVSSSDGVGNSAFGSSLSLSRDGSVLVVGGFGDNGNEGAVWQFGRTGLLSWTQQGAKLVPSDESAGAEAGVGVALSADGNTGFFGATQDRSAAGASWPFDTNVYLGSPNIGSNTTQNIALQVQNGFTVGGIRVVTQGARNLDFTAASSQPASGVCHAISILSAGSTCSININFAPTAAGLRLGAVLLFDGSDVLRASVFLHGIGLAPVVGFSNPVINTVAGNGFGAFSGTGGSSGDGGPALSAEMFGPFGLAVDATSDLYISDFQNARIRFVNQQSSTVFALGVSVGPGDMQTVAGNGTSAFAGDSGAATAAEINNPIQVALDGAGNLYIADERNNRIRKIDARSGIITTIAGGGGNPNDGILATSAVLHDPQAVAVGPNGDLFIGDNLNADNKVHRVSANTGLITTVAGTNVAGFSGEGGPATSASLNLPVALAFDSNGNLYIDDDANNVIREVNYNTGTINTVAGTHTGSGSFSGDGGLATSSHLNDPEGIAIDVAGDIYITDSSNNDVRVVNAFTGIISTISGSLTQSTGYSGDGGLASDGVFNYPTYPAFDNAGDFYVSDNGNNVIRKISGSATLAFANTSVGFTSAAQDVTVTNNGNAPLSFTGGTAPADFTLGGDTTCTPSTVLAPGQSCVLGIVFAPTVVGPLNETLTIVDNQGTQMISLSGTGVAATTTTTLVPTPNPATFGQSVTLTANVVPFPSAGSFGSIDFFFGATLLGSGNLDISGTATFSTSSLPVGADSLTAVYSGNSAFLTSTSAPVTETVNPALTSTSTALSAVPNPATVGQSVTITATVSPAPTGSPLGSVTFKNGTSVLGSGNVNSSGVVTFSTAALPAGTNSITAVYSGNAGFTTSTSSSLIETVTGGTTSTTITLAASPNPASAGQSVTFTATISPAPSGSSLGTVNFFSGATLLGTSTVNSSGVATLSISSLPGGADSITAVYSGNTAFGTSNSSALTETISPAYTVTAPAAPVTVAEGGAVAISLTVTPVGGTFNSVVTMSASGLPPGATATFNPPTVIPGAAGAPTMLTIQLLTASTANVPAGPHQKIPFAPIGAAVALCLVAFAYRSSVPRIVKSALVLVSLAFVGSLLTSCNGGFAGKPGTLPGNYTITITGTSGALQRSSTITLIVP
jgi:hypothetical protein